MASPKKNPRQVCIFSSPRCLVSILLVLRIYGSNGDDSIAYRHKPYPANDEYNFMIFNPETLYGSPYGGFARASQSRLAKLSMQFTDDTEYGFHFDNDDREERSSALDPAEDSAAPFFNMRDRDGNLFACRVYKQDELTSSSLKDSMFEYAIEKNPNTDDNDRNKSEKADSSMNSSTEKATGSNSAIFVPTTYVSNNLDHLRENAFRIYELFILPELTNVCQSASFGWWSYQWCSRKQVRQFHLEPVQQKGSQKTTSSKQNNMVYEKTDDFSLGKYKSLSIKPTQSIEDGTLSFELTETFKDGRKCDETNKSRETTVKVKCCHSGSNSNRNSSKKANPHASEHHKKIHQLKQELYRFVKIEEQKLCEYEATICSPLMCLDHLELLEDLRNEELLEEQKEEEDLIQSYKDLSIRDILKIVLADRCLRYDAGWYVLYLHVLSLKTLFFIISLPYLLSFSEYYQRWMYEFCHLKYVREFHPISSIDPKTGRPSLEYETEHKLGYYDPKTHDSFTDEDEHKHVVNVTNVDGISNTMHSNSGGSGNGIEEDLNNIIQIATGGGNGADVDNLNDILFSAVKHLNELDSSGGDGTSSKTVVAYDENGEPIETNGAFFVQEYAHGHICEDADVTDAAIKGGNVVDGAIERSTTMRFYCGETLKISSMNEDTTCHYIFDISVPELCFHPLFQAESVKKQVVKCLPVVTEI